MWPSSMLVTAERDGYFPILPSPRPNAGENKVYAREQPLQTAAENLRGTTRNQLLSTCPELCWHNSFNGEPQA